MRLHIAACILLPLAVAAAQPTAPRLDVPYVPTPNPVVDGMLKLAGVTAADTVYDLGCGDGRIVISAAKDYGAKGVGIDINPERIQEARDNAKKANVEDKVRFEENDLFKADITKASVVTLYLLPDVNQRLRPKLLKDLKPGSRIVSHSFDMGDWKPQREEVVDGRRLYLWTVPATGATTDRGAN
jgi:SAM-dependent methyltransferase